MCSLGGVVYQRTLVDATGHNPVMSPYGLKVDPGAESRPKVTAGWRTAGAVPHRNVIQFDFRCKMWPVDCLEHHLMNDMKCIITGSLAACSLTVYG